MRRRVGWALLGYAALALAVFRPTPSELAHTSPAYGGVTDDPMLLMWATSHVSRTLFRDPLGLFDAPIYHPARLTLAYSDHMIGQALVGLPIWLATENPLLEYNLLALASYVLGGAAAYAYARELGAGTLGAAVAGLVFAFNPYRFHSPLWLQVLFTPFVPLALLAWTRFLRTRSTAAWLAWVACWTAHGLMGLYLTLYFALVMGALVVAACVAGPAPRDRRLVLGLLAGPLATGLLLAPTLVPYAILGATHGHVRTTGIDTHLTFLLPGPGTLSAALVPAGGPPGRFGPGLAVWGLVILGLAGRGRAAMPDAVAAFARRANLLALAITLVFVFTPLRWQQLLPGLDMIRGTNRAFYLSLLFLGVAAAGGVDRLLATRGRTLAGAAIVVVLLADLGTPPRERVRVPVGEEVPEVYRRLADLPGDPVIYDHVTGPLPLARAMYFQIVHRRRMPTGYSGFVNPAAVYAIHRLFRFPAPEALHLMRRIDVEYVVDHLRTPDRAAAARGDPDAGLAVLGRFGADVLYRVEPASPPPLPAAVARDRTAWSARSTHAPELLERLRDGDPATAWRTTVPGLGAGAAPSITIDLGAPAAVTGLRCATPIDEASGVWFARIELSEDGATFAPAGAAFEPQPLAALYEAPRTVRTWEARFPPRPARWIRLVNSDLAFWGGPWVMDELDVLEPAAP